VTMQVVYADRGTVVTADNAATAWSANCTQCEGAALSLQIVVTGSGVSVTANNRALSTNAACLKCRTVSAAVQLVVRAPSTAKLSRQAMMQIRALRNDLLANLTAYAPTSGTFRARTSAPASAPRVSGPMQATTKQLQSVVSSDLGATSATHRIVVR
jgi:hypothetical protein